ncbi:CMRF35-like molecule 5 [Megalops cyprinoides]|uniref:CMRF35-like molecule 5 n=1 Tax=Megalops cyprinoides TaxID=118141 RepID=UPI001863F9C4|nr:CMRF35-like molecule 5 [Megalops cyprinoides]
MKSSVIFILFLSVCETILGSAIVAPRVVTGTSAESVTVQCQYQQRYRGNTKYWCRGDVYEFCKIVVKTTGPIETETASIREDKDACVISVTITALRREDQGKYWCVISKQWRNEYAPVYLQVRYTARHPTTRNSSVSNLEFPTPTTLPVRTFTTRPQVDSGTHSDAWSTLRWVLLCVIVVCPIAACLWKHCTWQTCNTHRAADPASLQPPLPHRRSDYP